MISVRGGLIRLITAPASNRKYFVLTQNIARNNIRYGSQSNWAPYDIHEFSSFASFLFIS